MEGGWKQGAREGWIEERGDGEGGEKGGSGGKTKLGWECVTEGNQ